MWRVIIVIGCTVMAVGGTTLLIDAAMLPNSVPSADTATYVQATYRAVLAIGILLLAIFGVLVVLLFLEKKNIEMP